LLWIRSDICGGERRIRRAEAGERATAASDQNLVTTRRAFHPITELVAEEIALDGDLPGVMELAGLEPATLRLPAARSPS
jgi:hypothetical protein